MSSAVVPLVDDGLPVTLRELPAPGVLGHHGVAIVDKGQKLLDVLLVVAGSDQHGGKGLPVRSPGWQIHIRRQLHPVPHRHHLHPREIQPVCRSGQEGVLQHLRQRRGEFPAVLYQQAQIVALVVDAGNDLTVPQNDIQGAFSGRLDQAVDHMAAALVVPVLRGGQLIPLRDGAAAHAGQRVRKAAVQLRIERGHGPDIRDLPGEAQAFQIPRRAEDLLAVYGQSGQEDSRPVIGKIPRHLAPSPIISSTRRQDT